MKVLYKILSVILTIFCAFVCLSGCTSYEAENANLPETEFVFPETTWGMSVNDVKQAYPDIHDISDPERDGAATVRYRLDEYDFYGVKSTLQFVFYEKDGKTWLMGVSGFSADPMEPEEVTQLVGKTQGIQELQEQYNQLDNRFDSLDDAQKQCAEKNKAYLGIKSPDSYPLYFLSIGTSYTPTEDGDKPYLSFSYIGIGFLWSHYDFQTAEQVAE